LLNANHLFANGSKNENEADLDPVLFSMSADKSVVKVGEEFSIDVPVISRFVGRRVCFEGGISRRFYPNGG
jgi:hypothetical protein